MERKWLWKKKSSDKSSGETDSSGSLSSHSERYSDDQEALKASPNHDAQSPEVTSKAVSVADDVNDSLKSLTERLSAALVNVSAKEDLVKQHAKVAEEAVAGWEKAENEAAVFKLELEATLQQNSALEDRVSHLDGALKECVRQLRQAREEQEQTIQEAVVKKTRDWESTKLKLESQIIELQRKAEANRSEASTFVDHHLSHRLQCLEKENSALQHELLSQAEELEVMTIERDLSTQAAETASKQHLESIKKVAKLEAECRRLKGLACKTPLVNDKSSAASSIYVESCMDSQSDSGERLNMVETDSQKMNGPEPNKRDLNFSHPWSLSLVSELDQFKNEKAVSRNLPASSIDIDLMDDFLEMERLASLPQPDNGTNILESEARVNQSSNEESSALKAKLEAMNHRTARLEDKVEELEVEKEKLEMEKENLELEKEKLEVEKEKLELEKGELEAMSRRTGKLEDMIEKLEVDKAELGTVLAKRQECLAAAEFQLEEAEMKLEELQKELNIAKESKQTLESQLISIEAEARTMSAKVTSLEAEVQKERNLSAEIAIKCQSLEEELSRTNEEVKIQKSACSNAEWKIKQEDLAVAAGKLAECQKTIASLGNQLKSLATLEDFLIDSGNIPEFSASVAQQIPKADEHWKLHSNGTFSPKRDSVSKLADESCGPSLSRNEDTSPPSSSSSTNSSTVLSTHVTSEKNRNGFAKFFSRTKSGIRLEI